MLAKVYGVTPLIRKNVVSLDVERSRKQPEFSCKIVNLMDQPTDSSSNGMNVHV